MFLLRERHAHTSVLQGLGLLPSECLVAKVAILGCSLVDGVDEVQLLHDDTRSKIEVGTNDSLKVCGALGACAVALNED